MPDGRVLQFDPPVVCSHETRWDAARRRGEDVKLERSPGWNLVRAERSKLCIYAYVEKKAGPKVSKRIDSTNNTREMHGKQTLAIASLRKDEYARSDVIMDLDLLPGESRGYWKYHAPGKCFKQPKAVGKLNNERATLPFDSGAEVSIVDSTFARKVGCYIDDSQRQECVGIGENVYMTEGRTKIKVTLTGTLVYYFDAWVGSLSGQEAILGMDFMVPTGIRLDLADGTLCLPDEVRIQLAGRRQLFSANSRRLELGQDIDIPVADSVEVPIHSRRSDRQKLWITRGERWVPTLVKGLGRRRYLRITNLSGQPLTLFDDTWIEIWLSGDHIPRHTGFISIGSRRYNEWQNLAYEATTDRQEDEGVDDVTSEPMVERPQYDRPTQILIRQANHPKVATMQVPESKGKPKTGPSGTDINRKDRKEDVVIGEEPGNPKPDQTETPSEVRDSPRREPNMAPQEADQVCIHEGGDLFAEDVESQMAVLPEVVTTTEEVTINNIQVGDPEINTPEEIDRLRHIIWKRVHLLIGRENALPPAASDADRTTLPTGRSTISGEVVRPHQGVTVRDDYHALDLTLASPIVIIIKKNGVDIRLCIDYRLVNNLTKLMVYTMPLINDLLEDLDKVLWYCSLDMASGFWVVSMTERARKISAFITPFGLFEWTRMPFGLKNAPQIYQRLIDNALYGHLRIGPGQDSSRTTDVFTEGEPEPVIQPSVLGRRSYIDDILATAPSWDDLCEKVETLHVHSAELGSYAYILQRRDGTSPEECKMSKWLRSGRLNYYRRFIKDFAAYAAVLYELREVDFHEIRRREKISMSARGTGGEMAPEDGDDRWTQAKVAFTMLKAKIVSTPVLRHFDPDRTLVVVLYASKWAISAALMQEHDGVYWPVTFTSRTLKPSEINYGMVDKEVLALLRILDVCYTQLVTRPIKVLSRHSTLAWLLNSTGFDGRLGNVAVKLDARSHKMHEG
ncbi:LOW QUALITY PROTEIN: Reverse transcriptase [Phytophthora palmivora]|uniref:Reverse transcriptase n=1 Tax=Phytophthora palmivora TaxID=4796 RepID=A0A2P4Y4E1_9STRA|nr:LOW QUALITY PROTEIN: Reverse transcriptase [Phytophthora palmivora]